MFYVMNILCTFRISVSWVWYKCTPQKIFINLRIRLELVLFSGSILGLVSLFNDISTFVSFIMPMPP